MGTLLMVTELLEVCVLKFVPAIITLYPIPAMKLETPVIVGGPEGFTPAEFFEQLCILTRIANAK